MIKIGLVLGVLLALPGAAATAEASPPGPTGTIAVTGGSLEPKLALISLRSRTTRRIAVRDEIIRYDFSPDGGSIAVTGFKGIWVIRRDGTHARLILAHSDPTQPGVGAIAWSPDGGRLVCARSDDTLVTVGVDGKGVRRIVGHADEPDWTPDGRIVFVRNPEQSSRAGIVSTIGVDGRGLRRLVSRGRWVEPHVSPDGSTVAVENGTGIFLAPRRGGTPRLFIRNGYGAAWSPDGRYLAFTRPIRCGEAVCTSRVFVVARSGGKPRAYGPEIGDIGPLSWGR